MICFLPHPSLEQTAVFISYSRIDLSVGEWLVTELQNRGYEAYLDKRDILPGEPWKERIAKLIEYADTILFLVSPASVASDICGWEVDEAERLSKRIIPVVVQPVLDKSVPSVLSRLNFVFLDDPTTRASVLDELSAALDLDILWVREHTRIGMLATQWAPRKSSSDLLRGAALDAAERWIAAQPRGAPLPSQLHRDFIVTSRQATTRRQRLSVAGALAIAVLAVGLSALAYWQRSLAIVQRDRADRELQKTQIEQSRFLADSARRAIERGDRTTGALLAMEGLPDSDAGRVRPYVEDAERALFLALLLSRERVVISHLGQIAQAHFTPDRTRILAATKDGRIVSFSVKDGAVLTEIALPETLKLHPLSCSILI